MGERTAPVSPLTALLLTAAGQPVVMHGSDRMPTKVWSATGGNLAGQGSIGLGYPWHSAGIRENLG